MQWIWLLIAAVLIQNVTAVAIRSRSRQRPYRHHKKHTHVAQASATSAQKPLGRRTAALRYQPHSKQPPPQPATRLSAAASSHAAEVEIDILKCPLGCVCQYARYTDLPISRWINYMQMRPQQQSPEERASPPQPAYKRSGSSRRQAIKHNEVTYEEEDEAELKLTDTNETGEDVDDDDENSSASEEQIFATNPYIKQATCILQEDADPLALIDSLPHDLQALILLYTGIGRNKTVNTSVLKPLNQLHTLEVRGSQDRSLRLVFNEPLQFLQHVNFESVTLLGSDSFSRPKNPVHPSDSFDYKPKNVFVGSYETEPLDATNFANLTGPGGIQLDFKQLQEQELEEFEILPYDIYMQKVKEARMPSFYGWAHLQVLRVHGCELNELYWEMFDGLGELQHLSLERNNIEMLPPFALYGALHIKTLSLAHNRIHELHYRALAGLLELQWLDLSANRLSKLSELSFPPFPKLQRIDFRHNPIRYIFPATFWVMNATCEMYFDSRETAVELWTNTPFISLVVLRELYMGNVSITNLEHNVFKGLAALEKLTLRGSIRSVEFDSFAALVALRELDMSNCQIQQLSMDAFIGCRKLEALNLAHNNISYIPPGLFDDQAALQEIYLEGNQLRALPYTFFLQPKLRVARLNDNPWQCNCDMSNWLPKVTNQERGARVERCVSDFQTGRKLACRLVENFKFDHRYAPRCDNYNGRSVYYVLRKQLQCGPGRVVHSRREQRKEASRPTINKQSKEMSSEESHHNVAAQTWKTRREQKQRRNMAQQNTLAYVLQQQQRARAPQQQPKQPASGEQHYKPGQARYSPEQKQIREKQQQQQLPLLAETEEEDEDISNDIF